MSSTPRKSRGRFDSDSPRNAQSQASQASITKPAAKEIIPISPNRCSGRRVYLVMNSTVSRSSNPL